MLVPIYIFEGVNLLRRCNCLIHDGVGRGFYGQPEAF